jgi:hypothetical protein
MLIAGVIVVCIVLLMLAFLAPRLSQHPQRGVGEQAGGSLPGKLGDWARKPFQSSRKATSKSASAGRKGRGKMPL